MSLPDAVGVRRPTIPGRKGFIHEERSKYMEGVKGEVQKLPAGSTGSGETNQKNGGCRGDRDGEKKLGPHRGALQEAQSKPAGLLPIKKW